MTVPDAIQFQKDHDWDSVRSICRQLNRATRDTIYEIIDTEPLCPNSEEWLGQMSSVFIEVQDPIAFKEILLDHYKIEIPVFEWNGRAILRFSFNAYNDEQDADTLINAIKEIL